jgi:hypothetical protein
MRNIYASAYRLCIWLGDATDDSDLAMDCINDMFENDGPSFIASSLTAESGKD